MTKNNLVKNLAIASSLSAAMLASPVSTKASDNESSPSTNKIEFVSLRLGYEYFDLGKGYTYQHVNHPNDSFLRGSPGSTTLERTHGLELELELHRKIGFIEPYMGISGIWFVAGEDKHKNFNDPRPMGQHSEVYSKIFPIGGQANAGFKLYPIKGEGLSLGIGVSGTFLQVDHGWNRFDDYESARNEREFLLNPVISLGFRDENSELVLSYSKGMGKNDSQTFKLSLGAAF